MWGRLSLLQKATGPRCRCSCGTGASQDSWQFAHACRSQASPSHMSSWLLLLLAYEALQALICSIPEGDER